MRVARSAVVVVAVLLTVLPTVAAARKPDARAAATARLERLVGALEAGDPAQLDAVFAGARLVILPGGVCDRRVKADCGPLGAWLYPGEQVKVVLGEPTIGVRGAAAWVTVEAQVTRAGGTTTLRITELLGLVDGAWRVDLSHLSHGVDPELVRRLTNINAMREDTFAEVPDHPDLAALLGDEIDFARLARRVSPAREAALFGSAAEERDTGGAKVKRWLGLWKHRRCLSGPWFRTTGGLPGGLRWVAGDIACWQAGAVSRQTLYRAHLAFLPDGKIVQLHLSFDRTARARARPREMPPVARGLRAAAASAIDASRVLEIGGYRCHVFPGYVVLAARYSDSDRERILVRRTQGAPPERVCRVGGEPGLSFGGTRFEGLYRDLAILDVDSDPPRCCAVLDLRTLADVAEAPASEAQGQKPILDVAAPASLPAAAVERGADDCTGYMRRLLEARQREEAPALDGVAFEPCPQPVTDCSRLQLTEVYHLDLRTRGAQLRAIACRERAPAGP